MATIESEIVTNIAQNTSDEAIEDTEEGEILEDGEIADEDDTSVVVVAAVEKKEEIKHEEKENKSNKDRDLRKREESTKRDRDREKGRDRDKEKDKDKEKEKERDRSERRHSYDRNVDRDKKSAERDRKSSNEDEREKRRRERERKRRRSEEEDEREKSQSQSQSRKRSRDNWNSESSFDSNSRTTFEEYARKPGNNNNFEELDFRLKDNIPYNKNNPPIHLEEDEDMPFDDRVFDEMIGMMDNRVPINREGLHAEKRGLMRAMAIMMRRNAENEKSRRTGRLVRDKRRPERTPGPTGTRASRQHTERLQSTPVFKAQCKFFIEGKCHKGADCSFSHDCLPAKKKEICKFYLQGFCGKGEDCLYMHNEFPCKFFHTNVECYSGENCRFSHAPLNEETREILRNYLDSGQLPDDPKPEKNNDTPKNEIKSLPNDMYSSSPNNSIQNSQQSATSTSPATSSSTYAPMKPVAKRHAILGDATNDMKSSYYTWVWQQEMKELEVAYVGNKRNLFCIEKPFVMSDKPPTPRIEDDEDEIEAQIRSYYLDTMGTMGIEEEEDNNNNNNNMPNIVKSEEQKLIEASAHDEDLRTFFMPSQTGLNDSSDNAMIKKEVKTDNDLRPKIDDSLNTNNAPSHSKSDSSMNLPKIESENKNASKVNVKQEPKSWLDDSDDDDKDDHVLAAALKNIESKTVQPNSDTSQDKSLSSLDISKMLSAIRQSSNPASSSTTNNLSKQTEFWQNILSGINLAGGSPSGNNTPPRHGYRDPRLKRGKDSSSPTPETTPILKICDPSVQIDYKLVPITITGIDYSCYVSIFRNDSRLKNDPRLSKFFSKLPTTEIDNLSRIIPPPLKTAPVTPLSVLKSKKRSEREKKESHRKAKPSSSAPMPPLPPLPPLTISPSKSAPTPGIIPPPPPPIMSPLELISSRPSFTVRESKSVNKTANDTDICEKLDIKSALLLSHSASSPEPAVESDDKTVTMKQETEIETTNPPYVPLDLNISSLNTVTTNSKPLTSVDTTKSSLSSQSSLKASDSDRYTPPLSSYNLNIKKESEELNDQTSKDDDLYDISFLSVNYDSLNNGQQTGVHSPPSDKNELQLICNELQSPIIDSDPEMEIDMTVNRKDSVSEMESSDECELTIASSSETEDNVNNDTESNNNNNNSNLPIDTILKPSNALLIDEPINLTVNDDSNNKDNVEQSDQSLKSVFSVIDPTASPFC